METFLPLFSCLNSCADKLVATEDRFVVKSVEIGTFALVGNGWRVVDVVTSTLEPSVEEVALNAGFIVKLVNEDVIRLVTLVEFAEAFDELS